jgi:hypothetical protein
MDQYALGGAKSEPPADFEQFGPVILTFVGGEI